MATWQRICVKLLLLGATVLGLLSYGGALIFLFLPLAIGYWWAVRHSGMLERSAWILVGSIAAALWAWEIAYPVTEGKAPWSWIVAGVAAVVMALLLVAGSRYWVVHDPSPA